MTQVKILIRGEEAEAFAEGLLAIEGIEQIDNSEVVYRGRTENIIVLTAAVVSIAQDSISIGKEITNLYNFYHDQQKIEVKIQQEDGELYDFQDLTTSFSIEPLLINTINESSPNASIPSLQEIAKLSIPERHRILSPFISGMAEDFKNDPELTIFSVLDGEGLEDNNVEKSGKLISTQLSF